MNTPQKLRHDSKPFFSVHTWTGNIVGRCFRSLSPFKNRAHHKSRLPGVALLIKKKRGKLRSASACDDFCPALNVCTVLAPCENMFSL